MQQNRAMLCYAFKIAKLFLKSGPFAASFLYFFLSIQFSIQFIVNKIANDWIQTTDLWYRKELLYQLHHNHCPVGLFEKPLNGKETKLFFKINKTILFVSVFCGPAAAEATTAEATTAEATTAEAFKCCFNLEEQLWENCIQTPECFLCLRYLLKIRTSRICIWQDYLSLTSFKSKLERWLKRNVCQGGIRSSDHNLLRSFLTAMPTHQPGQFNFANRPNTGAFTIPQDGLLAFSPTLRIGYWHFHHCWDAAIIGIFTNTQDELV